MIKRHFNKDLSMRKSSFMLVAIIFIFMTIGAFANDIPINMQGSTATILKGNTVTRKLYNIPNEIPGQIRLRLKWHAVNDSPIYNRLRVRIKHGNRILKTANCYSIHGNKAPKCRINFTVNKSETGFAGAWNLVITNNSNFEVTGFDIEKGSDTDLQVPSFRSVYRPNCPGAVNLDMEGTTLTLGRGNTQSRRIYGIGKLAGLLVLKAKWHAVSASPNYNRLEVQLLRPNGSVANSGGYYSVHAIKKSPNLNVAYNTSAREVAQSGSWKLRITNNSNFDVSGFNIEKERSEADPSVPNFFSFYKATCSF